MESGVRNKHNKRMIHFNKIYTFLDPFIASASGLVIVNNHFYVVSDDELSLVRLAESLSDVGEMLELVTGKLSTEYGERKKKKPDFESLVYLPHNKSILCLPSGSTANRMTAALVSESLKASELSLRNIFENLRIKISELNIEGAILIGSTIRLFQRGNGKLNQNGLIDLELHHFLNDQVSPYKWLPIDLGKIDNVPLTFTDACEYNGEAWFLAVAENTESTFDDGEYLGAVLGKMDLNGKILEMKRISVPHKPEGLFIKQGTAYIVTDADDRTVPSCLYSARI